MRIKERKRIINEWLNTPPEQREKLQQLRVRLGMRRHTFPLLVKEVEDQRRSVAEKARFLKGKTDILSEAHAPIIKVDLTGDYDSQEWLRRRSPEADEALILAVKRGNAIAIKLFKQLIGDLIEKQEVKVEFTADDITKRHLQAQRELRESGFRVAQVSDEPPLLSENIREG